MGARRCLLLCRQPIVQKLSRFFALQLFTDSSQTAVLRQSLEQGIDGFTGLHCANLNFAIDFFIRAIHFLGRPSARRS